MNKILIILLLFSYQLFGQNYKQEIDLMLNKYKTLRYYELVIKSEVFENNASSKVVQTDISKVKQCDSTSFIEYQNIVRIETTHYSVLVDHSKKTIVWNTHDEYNVNEYFNKQDSMYTAFAPKAQFLDSSNDTYHWNIACNQGVLLSIELFFSKQHVLLKQIMHYDPDLYKGKSKQVITYTLNQLQADDLSDVSLNRYIQRNGANEVIAGNAVASYRIRQQIPYILDISNDKKEKNKRKK